MQRVTIFHVMFVFTFHNKSGLATIKRAFNCEIVLLHFGYTFLIQIHY